MRRLFVSCALAAIGCGNAGAGGGPAPEVSESQVKLDLPAVPVSGTVDDVVHGLREVIDAGAEMILLNPVGATVVEDREQLERLAAEVMPQLS